MFLSRFIHRYAISGFFWIILVKNLHFPNVFGPFWSSCTTFLKTNYHKLVPVPYFHQFLLTYNMTYLKFWSIFTQIHFILITQNFSRPTPCRPYRLKCPITASRCCCLASTRNLSRRCPKAFQIFVCKLIFFYCASSWFLVPCSWRGRKVRKSICAGVSAHSITTCPCTRVYRTMHQSGWFFVEFFDWFWESGI